MDSFKVKASYTLSLNSNNKHLLSLGSEAKGGPNGKAAYFKLLLERGLIKKGGLNGVFAVFKM